jgi:hypothetical protein
MENHCCSSILCAKGNHLVCSTTFHPTVSSRIMTLVSSHNTLCDHPFVLESSFPWGLSCRYPYPVIHINVQLPHPSIGYKFHLRCQRYQLSKHDSTHHKIICFIGIVAKIMCKPLCY